MTKRLGLLAALPVALLLGAPAAHASTFLGSNDPSADPDAFACATGCAPGTDVVFRQFALRGATLAAPEDGVLVSAQVNAKRISGDAQPRIAVLRPDDEDGVGVTIADSAPIAVSSPTGETAEVEDLHLEVQIGDAIGLILPAGQVDLGTRARSRPDGAVQRFVLPCDEACGMDGGAGTELLFGAVVEPDVDEDSLGDETQDPDGGGLGLDWEDDWFEDYEEGDELDEDFFDEDRPRRDGPLRLLDVDRRRGRPATTLVIRVPRPGMLHVAITKPAVGATGAGPFRTMLIGDKRVRRAGRVRLRLTATPDGRRALDRRRRLRTKVVASLVPRRANLKVLMRSARV
jgi:hypothetical protein